MNYSIFFSIVFTMITLFFIPVFRSVKFTTMVYDNPEKNQTIETIVQPKQTFQLYYELAVAIIVVPTALFIFILWRMKSGKNNLTKSTAI